MDNRTNKQNYYLDIADSVLERSTCLRRKYGAIIVRNDEIISTGYNGAPRGRRNCSDLGGCTREKLHIPSGERYELCRSVHAEANAIISASRRDMIGSPLYLVGRSAATNELPDHQRRHRPRGDPRGREALPHRPRQRLDRKRRQHLRSLTPSLPPGGRSGRRAFPFCPRKRKCA